MSDQKCSAVLGTEGLSAGLGADSARHVSDGLSASIAETQAGALLDTEGSFEAPAEKRTSARLRGLGLATSRARRGPRRQGLTTTFEPEVAASVLTATDDRTAKISSSNS